MADEARKTLLEEIEEKNCPGCNIDRFKQEQRGIPYIHLSFIWLVSLCTALPISSLFPYLYFMIRDFHVAEKEEDIGFYAGFVASSFMIGRALTSILWGKLADRYGRKPIILMATFSVIIFNTLFGLSTSFWFAISVRFLLGCVNCLLGVIRAYASEVVSEEYHALSLSVVSTSRGIGLIIGPAIGGYLAQPAKKYPNLFSQDSVFGSFPYFLPSLVISAYATGALIACWWLPETLHTHCRIARGRLNPNEPEYSPNELNNDGSTGRGLEDQNTQSKPSLLRNRPLMAIIIVYCVFSLQEIAYSEIFSLWAVSDISYGGLSFSSQDVGQVLAISGLGLLLFQLMVYPPMEKSLGLLVVIRLSAVMLIPLLSCYPSIASLSGLTLHLVINCASILKNALSISLVTGLFILLNKAVPQSQRGAANGIFMTAMSIFKSFGPAGGGILFSWAQKRQTATFLPVSEMAKTRGGLVGSRRSRRNQGLEVVDQEDKAPQLKVKKRTAKKMASPKKNLVLTPTRRSSRIKKVVAEDDYIEDVTPSDDDVVEDVTPPKDDEVQDLTPAQDDEVEDVTPEDKDDQAEKSMSEEDKDDEEDVNGKEDEEDGDVNGKENEEDGDPNGKENEEEPANMEDDGVLNEKGNEEEACEEEARDMEEDGTAQDDEIPSTEGVELAREEVQKKNKRGPTKLRRVAENPNDKIMVTFNDIGEHVGPGSVTLSSFLGPLVREHAPVTLADW